MKKKTPSITPGGDVLPMRTPPQHAEKAEVQQLIASISKKIRDDSAFAKKAAHIISDMLLNNPK
jgi:hypothetical protein